MAYTIDWQAGTDDHCIESTSSQQRHRHSSVELYD